MASLIRSARHLSKFHPAAAVTIGHQPIGVSVCGTTPHERGYVTRAHATPLPTTPIEDALQTLLSEMDDRHVHRQKRWENNKEKRVAQRASYLGQKGKPSHPSEEEVKAEASSSPYRGMDETISLALQLNLDPRKPGQSLRGSLSLPHGNGKKFSVAVFTDDASIADQALSRGAAVAGGASLIESIKNGQVSLTSFQRTIASPEMMPQLSSIARLLGPRGLMPNPKLNTIQPKEMLLQTLDEQQSGISNYRTDKEGIVRIGVGRGSFGKDKLMDNVRELMNEIQGVKPESFGKGKKSGKGGSAKGTKYYLKAHLSSTQSKKSVLVDLRTLDPTSSFFMSSPQ
jgi:large subunit ribosomal protein L1